MTSLTKRDIQCRISGVVLGTLDLYLTEGMMAYLTAVDETLFRHPFYGLSWPVLSKKLDEAIQLTEEAKHCELSDWQQKRLQLLVSAMAHSLGTVKQDAPCLPPFAVAAGSARRLQVIAKWWNEKTTKRTYLPTLHISRLNGNEGWDNFKYWLDACFDLRNEWATKVRKMEHDAQMREASEDVEEIRQELVKRIDVTRVWNWIDLQLSEAKDISLNERNRWKRLFLRGDLEPELWHLDDLEDLILAMAEHCDTEHDIMFYIRKRTSGIKALMQDFYNSFNLLSSPSGALPTNDMRTEKETEFLADFDKQAAALEELPAKPDPSQFTSKGLYLQAEARWNILRNRWEQLTGKKYVRVQPPKPASPLDEVGDAPF